MFDVGFLEVLVIGVVALIVIGPEKLPAVARTVGGWVGKVQRFVRGVKSDFANELKSGDLQKIIGDQNDQINELRSLVNNARQELKAGVDDATSTTRTSMADFKKMVEDGDGETQLNDSPPTGTGTSAGDSSSRQTLAEPEDDASDEAPVRSAKAASSDSTQQSD